MTIRKDVFANVDHEVDVCVVGAGMAGLLAAVAAARHGAKVVLMHDRPVVGGNASSECRVHICGADRHNTIANMRETGILEEIRLENLARNPNRSFSVWDLILYSKARYQEGLTPLLNCSCIGAQMDGARIKSVTGWQTTTQTCHRVCASIFVDCSGDAVLAPLAGAAFRMGREARTEYNESIAPEQADARTMGMTCLFSARKYATPQPFSPPAWAYVFDGDEDLPYGAGGHGWWEMGYWWVELGGESHAIHDTEHLRDELLKIAIGIWDHIKNRGSHGAENWALDWLGFLPAKRESRRYIGEHILTQNDIEASGPFEDVVAYGGWTMDDHHPAGFWAARLGSPATVFHEAPSPYGIPYRSLYSKAIANLMFAGRCASATHAAMSSTRVMGTCSSMGQAAGTAAAMAARRGLEPRRMLDNLGQLQQALLLDDCYLPRMSVKVSPLTRFAALSTRRGNGEPVRDGVHRPVGTDLHAWTASEGDAITYEFDESTEVSTVTLVLDSALEKNIAMSFHQADDQLRSLPACLPESFHIDVRQGGNWKEVARVSGNFQRHVRVPVDRPVEAVRWTLDRTYGAEQSRVFAFYVD